MLGATVLAAGVLLAVAGCGDGSDGSVAAVSATGDPSATPSPSDSVVTAASSPSTSPSTTSSDKPSATTAARARLRLVLDQVGDDSGDGRLDFAVLVRNTGDAGFDGHLRVEGTPGGTPIFKTETQSYPWVNAHGRTVSDLGVLHVGAGESRTARFQGHFQDPRSYTLTARAGGADSNTWTLTVRRTPSATPTPSS